MRYPKIILFLPVLLFFTADLYARPIGDLLLEKGSVKIQRQTDSSVYQEEGLSVPLLNGDLIQTGPNSIAKIKLKAGDIEITLRSFTVFKLDEITQKEKKASLRNGKGRFLIRPKKGARAVGKRFRLKTANALIAVKGTDFVVGVQGGITAALTVEGIVTLASESEPDVAVELAENQASQVAKNKRPTAPVTVPPNMRESIIAADTATSFEAITFGEVISDIQTEQERKNDADIEEALRAIDDGRKEIVDSFEEESSSLQSVEIKIEN